MGWDASNGSKTFGPDYFSYYKSEIAELLSQDEDLLPSSLQDSASAKVVNGYKTSEKKKCTSASSSSLFYGCISPEVYELKREKLKSLLRRSVFSLSQDVDEMVDPVLKLCELKSFLLRFSGSLPSNSATDAPETDQDRPSKKLKLSTFPLRASESQGPEDKSVREPFSNACRLECNKMDEPLQPNNKNKNDDLSDTSVGAAKEDEVDGRLVLLQSESSIVEEGLKRVSDDLSAVLGHMEQELKELLDAVMSKCRLMTLAEKQELQRMIKNLPPRNLDSVAEIIHCQGQSDAHSCNEMHIDLEKEDNVKLWHLYFYAKAVENATKLRSAS
ncbi:hypothetical protein DM860_008631 [Cuscuta australis]|uniref:NET domain-containing protein n=1 Tax=Cuscuta australis TaxID=267555 RepID=A0A328DAH0_9ASTE|nr:hypothetical protein DM860_008631 [Cuscuta australis]